MRIKPRNVLYQNSQWAVTKYGLECRAMYYPIPRKRLHERNTDGLPFWLEHVGLGKGWVDVDLFWDAFTRALILHQIKHEFDLKACAAKIDNHKRRDRVRDQVYAERRRKNDTGVLTAKQFCREVRTVEREVDRRLAKRNAA
jgi:hypothetical protein